MRFDGPPGAGERGFPDFGFFGQGDNCALRARTDPGGKMQLRRSKEGGSVYAEQDRGVQHGNSRPRW
jgi:hypothetical protein